MYIAGEPRPGRKDCQGALNQTRTNIMKKYIIATAILLALFATPSMAEDAKHCIEFKNDTIINTCWEQVTVSWCYDRHDEPSVRCNTAPGERRFSQDVVLEARQKMAIMAPTTDTRIPFAACEGADSIEMGSGKRNSYICKEVKKKAVSLSLDL